MTTKLYYQSLNSDVSKPTAILIHGLFGSGDNLASLGKSLEEHYNVLLVDALNHGRSPHTALMDYPTQAKAVLDLVDSLKEENVTLIGHSMGGKVAMSTALLYPDRVKALVIADIAPVKYPRSHDRVFKALTGLKLETLISRRDATEQLSQQLKEPGVASFLSRSLYRDHDRWQWRFNLRALYANYDSILDWPFENLQYTGPVLFIKGMNSNYLHTDYQNKVQAQFPKAQLKAIADTGHWLHAEKPRIFNRIVIDFLQ